MTEKISSRDLNRMSLTVRILYGVVAAFNLLSFVIGEHDLNKLAIAVLLLVLIVGQKTLDEWRGVAREWMNSAEEWRKLAEERGLSQ